MWLLRLYPRRWRERYGDEMAALLEAARVGPRDRLDLVGGAIDAWIHPPTPSRAPAVAALVGGGLWTVVAAGVVFQPTPPDWPGYLIEVVPSATIAIAFLCAAVLGCGLRSGDRGVAGFRLTTAITVAGFGAWLLTAAATAAGWVDGPTLAVAQTLAIVGTALTGAGLVLADDTTIGGLVSVRGLTMLVPWSGAWLVFGAAWTAIGVVLWVERATRIGPDRLAS